jgi:hypothetical protein
MAALRPAVIVAERGHTFAARGENTITAAPLLRMVRR